MGIRDNLKKKHKDEITLVQAELPSDLVEQVNDQMKKDQAKGLDVNKRILVEESFKNYLQESGNKYKSKKSTQ